MACVHIHIRLSLPGDVDDAIARVWHWMPWCLLAEHLRRAGAYSITVSAEAV